MKMTLDEAIIHAKELSENQSICKDCREEHKQLAAWLEELKQYKEEQQEVQETNLEHYYDGLLKVGCSTFGVTDGKIKNCNCTACSKCEIRALDENEYCRINAIKWLASSYKKQTYKLTKFEHDILNAYKDSGMLKPVSHYSAMCELHEKGYFKDIDTSISIHEILENYEIKGEENYDEINY